MSGPFARHLGFTGTRHGLTQPQRDALHALFQGFRWLHHGDCAGADAEAHAVSAKLGLLVELHPPLAYTLRANCPAVVVREPLPYLERDRAIVDAVERVIACPATSHEELRSGTWATVRYTRHARKPLVIVFPDGTVTVERLPLSYRQFQLDVEPR